jgi:putative bacteriocin precursor
MKNLGKKRKLERMTVNAYGGICGTPCNCNCTCNCGCNCSSQPYASMNISDGIGQQMYVNLYYNYGARAAFNGMRN